MTLPIVPMPAPAVSALMEPANIDALPMRSKESLSLFPSSLLLNAEILAMTHQTALMQELADCASMELANTDAE